MKIQSISPILFLFLSAFSLIPVSTSLASTPVGCSQDADKQKLRSIELQTLAKEDQDDRKDPNTVDWSKVQPRDEARRKRVGEIFGEGCITTANDYSAAALIYQHGAIPDHYFQAFLWSKKASELGNSWEKHSVANGIDRYLVSIGHKQLFGTQFSKKTDSTLWCIEPLEKSFPDSRRMEYLNMNLGDNIAFFLNVYQSDQSPNEISTCDHPLKPSPPETIPGFW